MATQELAPNVRGGPFTSPRPALIAGVGAMSLALLLSFGGGPDWAVTALVVIGLLTTGAAVAIRPGSPIVLGLSAGVGMVAGLVANHAQWDISLQFPLRLIVLVAGLAAVLMLLPPLGRRAGVSLLILFHFGGIVTAITSASPPGYNFWLASKVYVYVYRPYLQFMYLNNAFHFYSPEPGPATLLWFRVEYEDIKEGDKVLKNWRWVKNPEMDDEGRPFRTGPGRERIYLPYLEYTRRLSLVDNGLQAMGQPPENFDELASLRFRAGNVLRIPMASDPFPKGMQYWEPSLASKIWISSYVRHVARTFHHEKHPELKVTGVKIYRVVHRMLNAGEIARMVEEDGIVDAVGPDDPTTYQPYYMGDYNPDGAMKETCLKMDFPIDGPPKVVYRDPFLYWMIPIVRTPSRVVNYVRIHAGDPDPAGEELP